MLLDRGIVLFRNQELTPEQHVCFSSRFGKLETFPIRPGQIGDGDGVDEEVATRIFRVATSKSHGYRGVGHYWHTDGYFYERPTAVSIMRSVVLPDIGGETWFANMYRAYETLPPDLNRRIEDVRAVSRPAPGAPRRGGLFSGTSQIRGVTHRLVRPHPVTARRSLYLNVGNMVRIGGLNPEDHDHLLRDLQAHIDAGDFTYLHRWAPGDLLMWDNSGVAHQAMATPPCSLRIMDRTSLAGDEYFDSEFWRAAGRLARDGRC